jgi:rhodanese-related sulfurtransferase
MAENTKTETKPTVSADEARVLAASNEAFVIDIRDDEAWAEGHVAGARHVSEDDLDSALEDASEGDRVLVVCVDGKRSAEVAESLRERGYEASSIEGGASAWESDKLPLQPSGDPDLEAELPAALQEDAPAPSDAGAESEEQGADDD